jgi:hypothetical protein
MVSTSGLRRNGSDVAISGSKDQERLMPRIAVALATVVLLAGSIGLNIVRYPAVWDMVADLPHTASAGAPARSASTAGPAKLAALTAEAKRPQADVASQANLTDKSANSSRQSNSPEPAAARAAAGADAKHPTTSAQSKSASGQPKPNASQSKSNSAKSKSTPADQPKEPIAAAKQPERDKDKGKNKEGKGSSATNDEQTAAKSKKRKDAPRQADGPWAAETAPARKSEVAEVRNPTAHADPKQPANLHKTDRPLVPVVESGVAASSAAASEPQPPANDLQPAFRRLPPVAAAPAGATTFVVPASYSRALPLYPSTGL